MRASSLSLCVFSKRVFPLPLVVFYRSISFLQVSSSSIASSCADFYFAPASFLTSSWGNPCFRKKKKFFSFGGGCFVLFLFLCSCRFFFFFCSLKLMWYGVKGSSASWSFERKRRPRDDDSRAFHVSAADNCHYWTWRKAGVYSCPFFCAFFGSEFSPVWERHEAFFRFSLDFLFSMSSSNVFIDLFIYLSRESTFVWLI